jgi:hypothetical protein
VQGCRAIFLVPRTRHATWAAGCRAFAMPPCSSLLHLAGCLVSLEAPVEERGPWTGLVHGRGPSRAQGDRGAACPRAFSPASGLARRMAVGLRARGATGVLHAPGPSRPPVDWRAAWPWALSRAKHPPATSPDPCRDATRSGPEIPSGVPRAGRLTAWTAHGHAFRHPHRRSHAGCASRRARARPADCPRALAGPARVAFRARRPRPPPGSMRAQAPGPDPGRRSPLVQAPRTGSWSPVACDAGWPDPSPRPGRPHPAAARTQVSAAARRLPSRDMQR